MMDRSNRRKSLAAGVVLSLLLGLAPHPARAQQAVQIRGGVSANAPVLRERQLAYLTDLNVLIIGTPSGTNVQIGARWVSSMSAPTSGLGAVGDFCVDGAGNVYQKTGAGWAMKMCLVGPVGPAGKDGTSAPLLYREIVGVSLPATSLGATSYVNVSWATPFSDSNFGVHYQLWPALGVNVNLSISVVSKTPTGCTLAVRAISLLSATGATVDVTAIHP